MRDCHVLRSTSPPIHPPARSSPRAPETRAERFCPCLSAAATRMHWLLWTQTDRQTLPVLGAGVAFTDLQQLCSFSKFCIDFGTDSSHSLIRSETLLTSGLVFFTLGLFMCEKVEQGGDRQRKQD